MYLVKWYQNRGFDFVIRRGKLILSRYGLTNQRILRDIQKHVEVLALDGCSPSLPIPGALVQRFPAFARQLQEAGVELAVHGFYHIDLNTLSVEDALRQLAQAIDAFAAAGIEVDGFRCPYIRCSDALLESIPPGVFDYSSNQAIRWELGLNGKGSNGSVKQGGQQILKVIDSFYQPKQAEDYVCVPSTQPNFIEIPFCIPDDLQLHDGYDQDPQGMQAAWRTILHKTHERGELFTLLYHSELVGLCAASLSALVNEARALQPQVWISRLREISQWWREKASFSIQVEECGQELEIHFQCSERATILARGLESAAPGSAWSAGYQQVARRSLRLPAKPRPFIGLPDNAPADAVRFLQEQGYLLETGEHARDCAMYLSLEDFRRLDTQVKLVEYIELAPGPLVRYGRWPNGARSAFCISGDMDALSLMDYAARVLIP